MKKRMSGAILIWSSLVMASLFFTGLSYAVLNVNDIAGMWLFDDEDDQIEDKSGNGNTGNIIGSLDWTDGKYGSALEFDGAGGYVDCGIGDSLNMDDEMTIAFWFYTDKVMKDMFGDRQCVIGKHYLEYEVGIYTEGQIHTYTSDGAGGYDEGILASIDGKLPDKDSDWEKGKWYHIAWTLNGADEVAYVNGIKIDEHTKLNEGTQGGAHPLNFGRREGGGLDFTGALDEVVILDVALEEEDIQTIVAVGLEWAFGMAAVSPVDSLTATWGSIKK